MMPSANSLKSKNPGKMQRLRSFQDLKEWRQQQGGKIAFVPTMGALHEGHLSLVREAKNRADKAIVSIFVNPKQFAPHEDLESYPRNTEEDCKALQDLEIDSVYLPRVEDLYPEGFSTTISVNGVSEPLEGQYRPHFFDGVATVVLKLFHQVRPDIALFGEKDFQQLQVIKKLEHDLNLDIEVIGIPTARDENGLALSSRNAYLSEQDYQTAIQMNKILFSMREKILNHQDFESIIKEGKNRLIKAGFDPVDYLEICHADSLKKATEKKENLRILAAASIGKTRLIDNIGV